MASAIRSASGLPVRAVRSASVRTVVGGGAHLGFGMESGTGGMAGGALKAAVLDNAQPMQQIRAARLMLIIKAGLTVGYIIATIITLPEISARTISEHSSMI